MRVWIVVLLVHSTAAFAQGAVDRVVDPDDDTTAPPPALTDEATPQLNAERVVFDEAMQRRFDSWIGVAVRAQLSDGVTVYARLISYTSTHVLLEESAGKRQRVSAGELVSMGLDDKRGSKADEVAVRRAGVEDRVSFGAGLALGGFAGIALGIGCVAVPFLAQGIAFGGVILLAGLVTSVFGCGAAVFGGISFIEANRELQALDSGKLAVAPGDVDVMRF